MRRKEVSSAGRVLTFSESQMEIRGVKGNADFVSLLCKRPHLSSIIAGELFKYTFYNFVIAICNFF